MDLKIDVNKIPVRIVQSEDIHGNTKVGVMLDISYYKNTRGDPTRKINKFKKSYFETVDKAQKLYQKTKEKGNNNTKYYWRLSNLLRRFNEKTENEFAITNYRQALQRDFGLTYSYIHIIFNFGKFFKKEEVLDAIPMTIYFELMAKKRKLDKLGLFDEEKSKLFKVGKEGQVPIVKEYKRALTELINSQER